MGNALLLPPLAFIIFLLLSMGLSRLTTLTAAVGKDCEGKTKAYACGENISLNKAQPEYRQFFPFAFFFTIMHVAALIIATAPSGISGMTVLYLAVAGLAIIILFRR
jgi:NADH:ubiquinone oxidoreductase subunit 3 (subunit A)